MDTSTPELIDRRALRQRRRRAVARSLKTREGGQERADYLLSRSLNDLLDRAAFIQRTFADVLFIGALDLPMRTRLPDNVATRTAVHAQLDPWIARTLSAQSGMTAGVCLNEEALPFAPASFDLIIAPLTLQFVNDLPGTLIQLRRALRPDGLLLASLTGENTLQELRTALLAGESMATGGAALRVLPGAEIKTLGGLLQRAGFALPVADLDPVTVRFASPLALMHDLRAMGASGAPLAGRTDAGGAIYAPLSRAALAAGCAGYGTGPGAPKARSDGRISATFDLITLSGWAPHASQQKPLAPGSATTRLEDALAQVKENQGHTHSDDT